MIHDNEAVKNQRQRENSERSKGKETHTCKGTPNRVSTNISVLQEKGNDRLVSFLTINVKFLNKTVANRFQKHIKMTVHHDQVGFIIYPWDVRVVSHI